MSLLDGFVLQSLQSQGEVQSVRADNRRFLPQSVMSNEDSVISYLATTDNVLEVKGQSASSFKWNIPLSTPPTNFDFRNGNPPNYGGSYTGFEVIQKVGGAIIMRGCPARGKTITASFQKPVKALLLVNWKRSCAKVITRTADGSEIELQPSTSYVFDKKFSTSELAELEFQRPCDTNGYTSSITLWIYGDEDSEPRYPKLVRRMSFMEYLESVSPTETIQVIWANYRGVRSASFSAYVGQFKEQLKRAGVFLHTFSSSGRTGGGFLLATEEVLVIGGGVSYNASEPNSAGFVLTLPGKPIIANTRVASYSYPVLTSIIVGGYTGRAGWDSPGGPGGPYFLPYPNEGPVPAVGTRGRVSGGAAVWAFGDVFRYRASMYGYTTAIDVVEVKW